MVYLRWFTLFYLPMLVAILVDVKSGDFRTSVFRTVSYVTAVVMLVAFALVVCVLVAKVRRNASLERRVVLVQSYSNT